MNLCEVIIMVMPLIWLGCVLLFGKRKPQEYFPNVILLGGCFALSFFLEHQITVMMEGQFIPFEVVYYGWFLFSLFIILQMVKAGIFRVIDKLLGVLGKSAGFRALSKVLLYILILCLAVPIFLAMTSIHRMKVGDGHTPESLLSLPYEEVMLKTEDNKNIQGWYIPTASKRAVLIAHGLGANKSNFLSTVELWHQLGFNVFIFDFRGHGASDGHTVSFGYEERLDVLAGVQYLQDEKNFAVKDIWGYGVSFGGAAIIHAANERHVFGGLVLDSSFASLEDMADVIVQGQVLLPAFARNIVKQVAFLFLQMDLGFDIRAHEPENVVENLAGTPLLLIHGKEDPLIDWSQTQRLFDAAKGPKEIHILDTEGHFGTLNDETYIGILEKFIKKSQ